MKEIHSNINIIGGGLIGSLTAYSLSKLGLTINILEKKPAYDEKKLIDYRTTAISEGTKNFLDKVGIWNKLKPFSQPIKKIKVIDRKLSDQLEFDNKRRESNLGYIIKNKHLLGIAYLLLKECKNVKIFNNIIIDSFSFNKEKIITSTKSKKFTSDLNISADGKNSYVRKIFKTPYFNKNYYKSAFVITFNHSLNHNDTAFELFYRHGPLAILPMKKDKGKFCSSIVWTHNNEYLKNLMAMSNKNIMSVLNSETQECVGKITKIISKQFFPLSAHINSKFYEERTIYVGDSAHSFHPIAGQGWNLGINDTQNLYKIINKYMSLGIDIGDSFFCKEYQKDNYYKAYRLYQVTDKLDSVFKIQNPIIKLTRTAGINIINKNNKIKNLISDFAMGIN